MRLEKPRGGFGEQTPPMMSREHCRPNFPSRLEPASRPQIHFGRIKSPWTLQWLQCRDVRTAEKRG